MLYHTATSPAPFWILLQLKQKTIVRGGRRRRNQQEKRLYLILKEQYDCFLDN
jgi:hypothetical protein